MLKIKQSVKIFLLPVILLASPFVHADYDLPTKEYLISILDQKYEIEKKDRKCETLTKLAKITMEGRQQGLSFDSQYAGAIKGGFPDDMNAKYRQMIVLAYKYPLFPTDSSKHIITDKFTIKTFLECREKGLERDWDLS